MQYHSVSHVLGSNYLSHEEKSAALENWKNIFEEPAFAPSEKKVTSPIDFPSKKDHLPEGNKRRAI